MLLRLLLLPAFLIVRYVLTRPSSVPAENSDDGSGPISASEIRNEFAHHDPDVARINNGSFGCCPASVLAAQSTLQLLYLRQPDHFYFNLLQPSILRSRSLIKDLINANHIDEVSIVDNATTATATATAIAIVLQHISWAFTENVFKKGDAVIMLQHSYGAVKNSVHAYISRAGGHVIEAPFPFPVTSNEEIILGFRKATTLGKSNGRRIRLAVIDHITSMPSVVIPVKELTKICRVEGVDQVFIDGAQAIGNVVVDVEDTGTDYYTSNLHKWFFCPPAAAFLYCQKSPSGLHHPVVSHKYGNGLAIESGWIGTRNYSPQLVLPSVMDFLSRFEGGIVGIQKRNHDKVVEMGEMLAESWRTGLRSPPDMSSSMIMVGLPECLGISSDRDAMKSRKHLREKFQVEVHIYYSNEPRRDGEEVDASNNKSSCVTGYVRISHQVYNVVDDIIRLRNAINKLIQGGFNCGMLPSN